MKTRLLIWITLLACAIGKTTPAWYFLPTFHEEVRGVEKPSSGKRPFFEALPLPAARLLKPDTPLTEGQRKELFWHQAAFPHRDFVRLMPENKEGLAVY